MKLKTSIPFSGFYESEHDAILDDALESYYSDDSGNRDYSEVEKVFHDIPWQKIHLEYAKQYTKKFAEYLKLETLEFVELNSPREYNFETDRIFCTIELWELIGVQVKVKTYQDKFIKRIKELFTSRSGFISFYSNNLEEWPTDIREWDLNQVGTLLDVYAEENGLDKLTDVIDYLNLNEIGSNIVGMHLPPTPSDPENDQSEEPGNIDPKNQYPETTGNIDPSIDLQDDFGTNKGN